MFAETEEDYGKSLLFDEPETEKPAGSVNEVDIDSVYPNPNQPRKSFDEDALNELAESIRSQGVIQPIIIEEYAPSKYSIIAGERRFRAAQLAGLQLVPVIVKDFNDKDALSLAIIENVQRSDLSVIEEAEAYNSLIKDFNYTQQDISDFVGKSRSHIANLIRLLDLPSEVKEMLYNKEISMGHARTLINCDKAVEIARMIIDNQLSVRETEKLVKEYNEKKKYDNNNNTTLKQNIKKAQFSMISAEYFKKIESNLSNKINLKTKINFNPTKKAGKIVINYNFVIVTIISSVCIFKCSCYITSFVYTCTNSNNTISAIIVIYNTIYLSS